MRVGCVVWISGTVAVGSEDHGVWDSEDEGCSVRTPDGEKVGSGSTIVNNGAVPEVEGPIDGADVESPDARVTPGASVPLHC